MELDFLYFFRVFSKLRVRLCPAHASFYIGSFLLFMALCSFSVAAQPTIEKKSLFTVYEKLKFAETEAEDLTLDLFIPNEIHETVPCIVVIQGGGFKSQDGQRFRHFAKYIAENHYAAALISYRGLPDNTYKTTIRDVRSAVCYICRNSVKYSIDIENIGVMGRSAGATLTALLAVGGNELFEKKNECDSGIIKAAVAYAGVFDFIARYTDSSHIVLQPNIKTKIASNSEWIGCPFSEDNQSWKNASAIYHADKKDPPILFIHCKDDRVVPWIQSQEMYNKMKDAGIAAEVLYFESGGHGFQVNDRELYLQPMLSFFKKHFDK